MPIDGSGDVSALPADDPRRTVPRLVIAGLMLLGFVLLGVAVFCLLAEQPLVAAAFSGACLLLWLAAAVLQRIGQNTSG